MSPRMSYGRHDGPAPANAREAAVAALLCPGEDGWRIPLTVRSQKLQRHRGQVSFPGGLIERGESVTEASLREVEEELGVRLPLEWLGELAPLYVFASNAQMNTCVGVVREEPLWHCNAAEVEDVVWLQIGSLVRETDFGPIMVERGPMRFSAPRVRIGDRDVWGATAAVLGELRGRMRRIAALS
jgi:8-oxo-dGTP pyrophosphatase MutT (NUDIX family)